MNKKILIDASYICYRGFHSNSKINKDGKITGLCNKEGLGTGMPYAAIQTMFYLMVKHKWKAEDVILVWDGRPQWRYDLYLEYKAGRKKDTHPESMSISIQFKIARCLFDFLGFSYIRHKDYEGDDIIASFATKEYTNCDEITIVGSDHDMYQCLRDNVNIMRLHQGKPEEIYTMNNFIDEFKIKPELYVFLQALSGCTTDKVPGMHGIGENSVLKLFELNNVQKIFNNEPDIIFPDKRTETMYKKNYNSWEKARDFKLVKLVTDCAYDVIDNKICSEKVREWFVRLGFKQYLLPNNFDRLIKIFGGK